MTQIPLINQPRIPFLSQNQKLITSCTHRLLQLQNQLQTKNLHQQLVSSLTMKEFSLKKLIQQQNLLISYLKDELHELHSRRAQSAELQKAIIQIQEKYLALGELKSMDQAEGQKFLSKLKIQYTELHDVLNQMTKESSTLYELKLKRCQRNSFSQGLLKERISQFCTLKEQHTRQFSLNESLKVQTAILSKENDKNTTLNLSLIQQAKNKSIQLDENKIKLVNLQKQVEKYEEERARLKIIEKAASRDNIVLKENLKDKVQEMKKKQELLNGLNKQKQSLQKIKTSENQRLARFQVESAQSKDLLIEEEQKREVLRPKLQVLTKEKLIAESELQRLQQQLSYLKSVKKSSLHKCLQTQQNLEKSLYFLDQYVLINSELISEIQILLSEEISKSAKIQSRNHYQINRTHQIMELREFLSKVMAQMDTTQIQVDSLVTDFNNYKLC